MAIMRMPLNPNQPGNKIIFRSGQTIVGLGYDCKEEFVYWTDVSGRTINRARSDGSDSQVVISQGELQSRATAVALNLNLYPCLGFFLIITRFSFHISTPNFGVPKLFQMYLKPFG